MHGGISVAFWISMVVKLQNGENCCAVTSLNGLFDTFNTTNWGRMPRFGTISSRQLPIFKTCSGALIGFSNFCQKKKKKSIRKKTHAKNIRNFFNSPANRPTVATNDYRSCVNFSVTAFAAIPLVLWWVHSSKGQWPCVCVFFFFNNENNQ